MYEISQKKTKAWNEERKKVEERKKKEKRNPFLEKFVKLHL